MWWLPGDFKVSVCRRCSPRCSCIRGGFSELPRTNSSTSEATAVRGNPMYRPATNSIPSLVLVALGIGLLVVTSFYNRIEQYPSPQTGQAATPSSLPPGTRETPWKINKNSHVLLKTTPPAGFTPPPFSFIYTPDQAIATALAILKRTQYTSASARRTTRNQISELFNRAQPTQLAMPTEVMPGLDGDYSSVVWVVVLQLPEPYSQFESVGALGLPVFVPTASAISSTPDLDTYGNWVCVIIDELGNPRRIRLLDPYMVGSSPSDLVLPLDAFTVLGEVGASVPPTP